MENLQQHRKSKSKETMKQSKEISTTKKVERNNLEIKTCFWDFIEDEEEDIH